MFARRSVLSILSVAAMSAAPAGVRTTVELRGDPGPAHRLAQPGIAVTLHAWPAHEAEVLSTELTRELRTLVYTRPLAAGEAGDYDLAITAGTRVTTANGTTVPFEIVLTAADGSALWKTTGRTDVEAQPVDDAAILSIARNVVSALMHDGWIQQRIDPKDLPPPPPAVRRN